MLNIDFNREPITVNRKLLLIKIFVTSIKTAEKEQK